MEDTYSLVHLCLQEDDNTGRENLISVFQKTGMEKRLCLETIGRIVPYIPTPNMELKVHERWIIAAFALNETSHVISHTGYCLVEQTQISIETLYRVSIISKDGKEYGDKIFRVPRLILPKSPQLTEQIINQKVVEMHNMHRFDPFRGGTYLGTIARDNELGSRICQIL